jgi:hypothetical protein
MAVPVALAPRRAVAAFSSVARSQVLAFSINLLSSIHNLMYISTLENCQPNSVGHSWLTATSPGQRLRE